MRLATFTDNDGGAARLGWVVEDRVLDLAALARVAGADLPETMLDLIASGPRGIDLLQRVTAGVDPTSGRPLAEVRLLAPIPRPRKNIFCVGMNYLAHAIESARAHGTEYKPLQHPAFFSKVPTTVSGPYDPIPYPTGVTEQLDWEVELAVVIGRGGRDWRPETALAHIFGFTVVNDVSARDVQNQHGGQFFKGKSLDGCCPMGPWIVTRDEVPDPQALRLTTHVNGVLKQDSTTADMIFDIAHVLAELSQGMTLEPGDVISTGTPSGVGMGRTPQEWLHPGDVVEVTVEGVGTLRNEIVKRET